MPLSNLVSHSKPLPSCWAVHPYKDSKKSLHSKPGPSLPPVWEMYLPNFHLVLGPFSPANEISGCTMRQYGKKAMEREGRMRIWPHMCSADISKHISFIYCVLKFYIQALSCPLTPSGLGSLIWDRFKAHCHTFHRLLAYCLLKFSMLTTDACRTKACRLSTGWKIREQFYCLAPFDAWNT